MRVKKKWIPPAHSRQRSSHHLSHVTTFPTTYFVLLSCWETADFAPSIFKTLTFSARHLRPAAFDRAAVAGISTCTKISFLHFFQPVNAPCSGTMLVREIGSSAFFALRRFAPYRSAPYRFTPCRSAPCRSAPCRFAPCRFAPCRFALRRFALRRSAPCRFAPCRFAPCRFALHRSALRRFAVSPTKSGLPV